MVQATGLLLASFMAVAMLYEINADDFFGTGVCILVVVFGIQLMLIGTGQTEGEAKKADETDPLQKLWRTADRAYPIPGLTRNSRREDSKSRSR